MQLWVGCNYKYLTYLPLKKLRICKLVDFIIYLNFMYLVSYNLVMVY